MNQILQQSWKNISTPSLIMMVIIPLRDTITNTTMGGKIQDRH